ncbi:MAG: alpha/beta hydrolase [Methanoregula sp.]
MATYILVHGGNMSTETWNKLTIGDPVHTKDGYLGAGYWDGTVSTLRSHNHRVFAPTLMDENRCHLIDHIGQVCSLITENNLRDVILVGHSYGGMVITGVADKMADRINRLVYLDAALPDPGESLYDLLNQGLPASSGNRPFLPEPALPYVEKLQFDASNIDPLPKTYILCTKSEFKDVTIGARQKIAAAKNGWTYIELPSSHVPMADMPDEFYRLMLDAARK